MIFKEWYGLIFCWVPSKSQPLYCPANALYWCTETWLNVLTGDSVLHPPLLVPTGSRVALESTCTSGVEVWPGRSSLDQGPFNLTGLFPSELNYHLQDWRPFRLEALSSIVGISQSCTVISSPNPIPGALGVRMAHAGTHPQFKGLQKHFAFSCSKPCKFWKGKLCTLLVHLLVVLSWCELLAIEKLFPASL